MYSMTNNELSLFIFSNKSYFYGIIYKNYTYGKHDLAKTKHDFFSELILEAVNINNKGKFKDIDNPLAFLGGVLQRIFRDYFKTQTPIRPDVIFNDSGEPSWNDVRFSAQKEQYSEPEEYIPPVKKYQDKEYLHKKLDELIDRQIKEDELQKQKQGETVTVVTERYWNEMNKARSIINTIRG